MFSWNPFGGTDSVLNQDQEVLNQDPEQLNQEQEQFLIYKDQEQEVLNQEVLKGVLFISDTADVDHKIALERHNSLLDLKKNIEDITFIQHELSKYVHRHGEKLDKLAQNIDTTEHNTSIAASNIEMAAEYARDKFIIARDVAIVLVGGVLGTVGLLAGPFIGTGTILAGVSAGGATVAGIHKIND